MQKPFPITTAASTVNIWDDMPHELQQLLTPGQGVWWYMPTQTQGEAFMLGASKKDI